MLNPAHAIVDEDGRDVFTALSRCAGRARRAVSHFEIWLAARASGRLEEGENRRLAALEVADDGALAVGPNDTWGRYPTSAHAGTPLGWDGAHPVGETPTGQRKRRRSR